MQNMGLLRKSKLLRRVLWKLFCMCSQPETWSELVCMTSYPMQRTSKGGNQIYNAVWNGMKAQSVEARVHQTPLLPTFAQICQYLPIFDNIWQLLNFPLWNCQKCCFGDFVQNSWTPPHPGKIGTQSLNKRIYPKKLTNICRNVRYIQL